MAARVLVEPDLPGGAELIAELDRDGLPMVAAYWRYATEERDLALVIASPSVDVEGRLPILRRIQAALTRLPQVHLLLQDVTVVKERDPLVAKLRCLTPSQLADGHTFRVYFSTWTPGYTSGETVYVYFVRTDARQVDGDPKTNGQA